MDYAAFLTLVTVTENAVKGKTVPLMLIVILFELIAHDE
jgi:hypothetical protein